MCVDRFTRARVPVSLNERANSHGWLRETHARENEGYRLGMFPLPSCSRFIYPNTRGGKRQAFASSDALYALDAPYNYNPGGMPRDEPRRELYEGETVVAISRIAVSASGRVVEAGQGLGEAL